MLTGIFSTLLLPETMGRSLEDISNENQEGFYSGKSTPSLHTHTKLITLRSRCGGESGGPGRCGGHKVRQGCIIDISYHHHAFFISSYSNEYCGRRQGGAGFDLRLRYQTLRLFGDLRVM